jgi:DNA-binding NarL/FixJ family response regulator
MPLRSFIRLVIADDHSIFRKAIMTFLPQENSSIQVVGEAEDGEELIREVESKKPDIVVTDVQMPIMSGSDATRIITKRFSSLISVIALTMFADADTIYKMFESGAKGYVTKNAGIAEVADAINTVYLGEMYYCSSSSISLIKKIGPSKYNQYKKNKSIQFSEREIELIRSICFQLTTKEIADKLKISSRTVEEYSHNIKEKIKAKSLVGIALYGLKNNIVSPNEI